MDQTKTNTNAGRHTPGKWESGRVGARMTEDYSQPFGVYVDDARTLICGCFGDIEGGEAAAEGNARLIAAAPSLLAECEALIASKTEFVNGDFDGIRAAIALARKGS